MRHSRKAAVTGFLIAACFATPRPRAAAGLQSEDGRTAAFLFAYTPEKGSQAEFDDGYRRHLDWHRQKGDSLVWYGWYVVAGDRMGTFIDGTFGVRPEAMDRRVDPAGDAADFARNVAPLADPLFRAAYRVRPDLSTSTPLEGRRPAPLVHVYHYSVEPGAGSRFEEWAAGLRGLIKERGGPAHTWYELMLGGEHPGYMLMISTRGMARIAPMSLEGLDGVVSRVRSETWRYRDDLSYLPE